MEMSVSPKSFDMPAETDIAWCPGCGNFPLLTIMKMALAELNIAPEQLVTVSGIGQAAKAPHYFKGNVFNGLRNLPLLWKPEMAMPMEKVETTLHIRFAGIRILRRSFTTTWCMD